MMLFQKNTILIIMFLFGWNHLYCSQVSPKWTFDQINKANTAKGIDYLNNTEKEAITILNLARLYPKKFIEYELKNFHGTPKYGDYLKDSKYKVSLVKAMNKMTSLPALTPDVRMTKNAKCFAFESGKNGYKGHKRKNCKKENYAECCSYGMETGKEIILQLLIDHNVSSLGHRRICFSNRYTKIGIGVAQHKKWDRCCVIEMI